MKRRSFVVKFSIFVRPISHWLRLLAQFGIRPCDGYGQSFPKWYDTWCSAENWVFQAIFKIFMNFFPIFIKIKNLLEGPHFEVSGPSKTYFGTCLMVHEGFPWKNLGVRCRAADELNYCPLLHITLMTWWLSVSYINPSFFYWMTFPLFMQVRIF